MEQYFSGRTRAPIEETIEQQEKVEDKIFSNERVDDRWNKSHLRIFNSTFAKMGFRSSQFKQCDLSFCVFIDCYFKKTFFDQVKFISCIFINCNFDMATFLNCDFKYATFENCFIPYVQMKNNLPHKEENLCSDLCRNLSLQCLKLGEVTDYKLYLFEERAAGETHSIRKLFHESGSYYSKYSLFEGIGGLFDFLRSKISKFMWGYGERMTSLLRCMVIVILAYSYIFYSNATHIVFQGSISNTIIAAIYLSACNFFSFADSEIFETQTLQFIGLSEYILGVTLMGFFVAALFRQINRR